MLTLGGRRVTALRAGTYLVSVLDRSRKAGLALGRVGGKTTTLSGVAAVGRVRRTLVLTAGRWFLASTPHGAKSSFTVR